MAELEITVDEDEHNKFIQQERPNGLSYQPTAPFLYAEFLVFSVLSKTSVNIGAESTLKYHPSINARAVERNLLTVNRQMRIQNPTHIKCNLLQSYTCK